MRDIRTLPKANLHLHLTGAMRPATMRELARKHGIPLPGPSGTARTWQRFQASYDAAREVIQSVDDMARVVREAAADDAAAGASWLEIQVDPTAYAPRFGGYRAVIEAAVAAAESAASATGVGVGIVVASSWARSGAHAEMLAALAAKFAGQVVGFGLSNDERRGRVADFRAAFRCATDAGLLATPHAGSFLGSGHVRDCVEQLGAHRIGHGIAAATDSGLLAMLAERSIVLEVCPSAYPAVGILPDHTHLPLRRIVAAGVPVALSTDDPLLFQTDLAGQYAVARDVLGFTDAELAGLARGSIQGAAAPDQWKRRELHRISQWLA